MSSKFEQLRESVIYSIANSSGRFSFAEKIFALKDSRSWSDVRLRDQADILMGAGCYDDAIPQFASISHWRKVGDALFAMDRIDEAKKYYERGANETSEGYKADRNGPDHDRLIALAARCEDWHELLAQIRAGTPEPLSDKDIIFGGSSRAKGPLLKLFAHAAVKSKDQSAADLQHFFGLTNEDAITFLAHARDDGYSKNVARFTRPPFTKTKYRSLSQVLAQGCTARSKALSSYLSNLESAFAEALDDFAHWKATGKDESLEAVILWLTVSESYEVFESCLFSLQCEYPTFGESEPWEIEFYSAHPWLTRAGLSYLLKASVAGEALPDPSALVFSAFQYSAAPFDFDDLNLEYDDPLIPIRAQPVWAEAVIGNWQESNEFAALWENVCSSLHGNRFRDMRKDPSFKAMAASMSDQLLSAWRRDFDHIRWKSEHLIFLRLGELLPDTEILQHAQPVWLAPQHLDVFVPRANLAIEFQGEQHFGPVDFFGGEEGFRATKKRDANKKRLCQLAGVALEYIRYDEDREIRIQQISKAILLRSDRA